MTEADPNVVVLYAGLREYRNAVISYVRGRLLEGERSSSDLDEEIQDLFKREWNGIEQTLNDLQSQGSVEIAPVDSLDKLSVNHFRVLFDKYWKEVCPLEDFNSPAARKLKGNVQTWTSEITTVRNPVAHPAEADLTVKDTLRYLDSARRLLEALELPAADGVNSRWNALVERIRSEADDDPLLEYNLPSRESVTTSFVGREGYLDDLWSWITDPDQRVWALVADGGKGKTTIAYEFTVQVRGVLSDFGLNGFIWMSAKQRRFVEGVTVELPSSDFGTLDGLLELVLEAFGLSGDLSTREKRSEVLDRLVELPMLIVADDVDSLAAADEDAISFLLTDVPATGSRVLITSRRRPFGLTTFSDVVGMSVDEVAELVEIWASGSDGTVKRQQVKQIHSATDGCPLFVEDLLRLARFQGIDAAISSWSGKTGDSAREYSLKRELEILSNEARNLLEVVALADSSLSLQECVTVLGSIDLDSAQVAMQELSSWSLITTPTIVEDIPRFGISRNLSKLLRSILKQSDRAEVITNGLKQLRGIAVGRGRIAEVTRQAVALKRSSQQSEAEETLLAGLGEAPNSSDLHAMLGWLYCRWEPNARLADADEHMSRAEALGGIADESYFHWANAHLRAGQSQEARRICNRALDANPNAAGLWRLRGLAQTRIGLSANRASQAGASAAAFREAEASLLEAQKHCDTQTGAGRAELSRVFAARYQLGATSHNQGMRRRVLQEWRRRIPDDPYMPETSS